MKIKTLIPLILVFLIGFLSSCKKDDTTPPVITLKGNNPMIIPLGATYNEPGATATDDTDGDISDRIQISGAVDNNNEGTYLLKYNVSDEAGNAAIEKSREVQVMIF